MRFVLVLVSVVCSTAFAQAPNGEALFTQHCAVCHANPAPDTDIPTRQRMRELGPDAIVASLTEGNMRIQGQPLSPAERVAIAELVAGRPISVATIAPAAGLCTSRPATLAPGPAWTGWSPDARNTRFQADSGGLNAANVPNLKLKWAFGVPNATQSRSQPAVIAGRLFMASQSGMVYALDARTGCTHWTYKAQSGVRTAVSFGPVGANRYAIYFADAQARAYAVDADTGAEIWSYKVDDHPAARATGAPTLYEGRLYVVTSGVSEETAAAMPDYECCKFRGSLTALDAATGALIWKTYTVDEPKPRGTSTSGKQLWGPAGSPIWSAPTIDAKRGLIYAATGNAYADPPPKTSDSIVAFDLKTGKIRWVNQVLPDVWILGCGAPPAGLGPPRAVAAEDAAAELADNPNCPNDVGPDFDFSASPALVTIPVVRDEPAPRAESRGQPLPNTRDLLLVTQKSGVGYALNPDRRGKIVWEYRWGRGSPVGGVWGLSTDGERAYFAVADQFTPAPGGLHAVNVATGERVWYTPPQSPACGSGPGCNAAQSAAVTSIPGVVFSGSADGAVRAYSSGTGAIIWTYNTNRDFETVNGVKADGGSIDGPGPVVAGGMLYVTAGNAGFVGTAGNVLLAFGPE
jgi:polyvinyl alcohol dehydrogenase (cytochrome)